MAISLLIASYITGISNISGIPLFVITRPFSSFTSYLLFALLTAVLIILYTSALYFSLHRLFIQVDEDPAEDVGENENADEEYEEIPDTGKMVRITLILFAVGGVILMYLIFTWALRSLRFDAFGSLLPTTSTPYPWTAFLADSAIAAGIAGMAACWFLFLQNLLDEDVVKRFEKMVRVIPVYSAFLITTFIYASWFFYAAVFPFWWYFFTFGIIYGMIYYLSLKDFHNRIQHHLTQSGEYEEVFTPATISVIIGFLILFGIVLTQLGFKTLPIVYAFSLFVQLWIVAMYMMPGKVFRQIRVFPRYATGPARVLGFVRYTRKYLLVWFIIFFLFGSFLGKELFLDPGLQLPGQTLARCSHNLTETGETLEQYMRENKGSLPNSKDFNSGDWLNKVSYARKISSLPRCPAGGELVYKKWRDEHKRPVYEVRCQHNVHFRAGVEGNYPRYRRFDGLVLHPEKESAPIPSEKAGTENVKVSNPSSDGTK